MLAGAPSQRACRQKVPGTSNLLRIQRYYGGRGVLHKEFEIVSQVQPGFIARGNDVGHRHLARPGRALHMAQHAAALTDKRDTPFTPQQPQGID